MKTKLLARLIALVTIISILGPRSSAFFTREQPAGHAYHHHIVTWALQKMGGFSPGLIDDLLDPTEDPDGHALQLWQDRWPDWVRWSP